MNIIEFIDQRIEHAQLVEAGQTIAAARRSESDRGIMNDHIHVLRHAEGDATGTIIGCIRCTRSDYDLAPPATGPGPCLTLRWLAASWRDHPDYDLGWAPELDPEPILGSIVSVGQSLVIAVSA